MLDESSVGPILLTGAAGRVGTALRPMLQRWGPVRLVDRIEPTVPPAPGETLLLGDLRDVAFAGKITKGVSAIVHLAGEPSARADWSRLLESNMSTGASLLEAARAEGVRRIVLASSVHAIGADNDPQDWPVPAASPAHPCCPYGVSKGALEAMARLYSEEVDSSRVSCLRLALVTYPVRWREEARAWLAEEDLRTLVAAAVDGPVGFGIYVGASDCPRPRFDLSNAARELGWRPTVQVAADGWPDDPPGYADRCRLWLR